MGKGTGLISTYLGRELKAQLMVAVRSTGTTQSRFVRRAIAECLRNDASRVQKLAVITARTEDEIRVHAYLPRSIAEWYTAAARSAGTTRSSYLRAQLIEVAERVAAPESGAARAPGIRSAGTLREALVESNAHLAAIERSVSQMSRALEAYPGQVSAAHRENLAAIGRAVTEHLEVVSRTLTVIRAPRAAAAPW
jgi:hypothetical protein